MEFAGIDVFYYIKTKSTILTESEQKIVIDHLKEGNREYYDLHAAIVMPDHVHFIIAPYKNFALSRIMKGIKGVTARKINQMRRTIGSIWQAESFDRIIRDENELLEKMNYMLKNPMKRGLTDDPYNYHGWFLNIEDS